MVDPVIQQELDTLYALIGQYFPDNTAGRITPADARRVLAAMVADSRLAKTRLDALTTNQVRGSVFRVPYVVLVGGVPTVPTVLIAPSLRILGMEALATNGTDATTAAAGVRADPITFQLVAHSTGAIDALVDEKPTTTSTVKARWVRTSGTDVQKIASYLPLPLEDQRLYRGEVYQYTFVDLVPAVTRLIEVRNNMNLSQNPVPTGLDSDPYYKPFAPLAAAAAYDDAPLKARVTAAETAAAALKGRLDAVLAGANGAVDTFIEAFNRFVSDETAAAALTAQVAQKADLSELTWRYVGSPATKNLMLGLPSPSFVLAPNAFFNTLRNSGRAITLGPGCVSNDLGPNAQDVVLGANCRNCQLSGSISSVELGAGCVNVQVIDCVGNDTDHKFLVPANTQNAVYRNNVLVPSGGGASGPWPPFTAGISDVPNRLFRATSPPNMRTAELETTSNGGIVTTAVTDSMRSGDVVTVPVPGTAAVSADQVGLRARQGGGRAASAWLFNQAAYPAVAAPAGPPLMTGVSPFSGPPGTTTVITGDNLGGAFELTINGVPFASFVVNSAWQVTAVTAANQTTGQITIVTPGGRNTTGSSFTVT